MTNSEKPHSHTTEGDWTVDDECSPGKRWSILDWDLFWAAITKYHKLDNLNRNLFLTILEHRKFKTDAVSSQGQLPDSQGTS
jgi:hypothetical protein